MVKKESKKKKKFPLGLILGIIPLLFLIYLAVGPFFHTIRQDLSAKDMYVIAEWVNVRIRPDAKSLKMGKILFGTKVSCYGESDGWSEVLVDNAKGYVSSKFIVDTKTFYYLDGLFADKKAARKITSTKYRMALVRYIIDKGYTTNISEEARQELDEDINNEDDVYQLEVQPAGSKYNTVVYSDFNGDGRKDVAFVLTNKVKDINRLVILSLDKDNPFTMSKVLYDNELEHSWQFIRLKRKGKYYSKDNKKIKLPLNGLLVGSNRNKSFNDKSYLLLYDGTSFEKIAD